MFLLIDKPKGMTSHDVIGRVRKITSVKRVGHGGTLDPNATGLLIVGVGREYTRQLGKIAKDTKKIYETEIFLGEERDTDDIEGKIVKVDEDSVAPQRVKIEKVLKKFEGVQMQTPPAHSAIKINGKKAYEIARRGDEIAMKPREIVVHSIKVVDYKYPILTIKAEVSSGTYIRSLARDIGRDLGTFAYLKNLRRVRIGKFRIENAIELEKLTAGNWERYGIENI